MGQEQYLQQMRTFLLNALAILQEKQRCALKEKGGLFESVVLHEGKCEPMVLVNHARTELRKLMIQKGICYLRAGDSKGSVLVQPGFERMQYVLLHTAGNEPQLFKLKTMGKFQIWTKETLVGLKG